MGSSTTRRRAGLSKNARPPPLLQSLPLRDDTKPAATSKKRSRIPEKEVDISAPPISSDDESSKGDEPNQVVEAGKGGSSPSSSGDESPDRADIRPTAFPSSLSSTAGTSYRSQAKYGSSERSSKTYGSARSSQESKLSSSQRSRNAKESRDDGLGSVKRDTLLRDPGKRFTKGKGTKPSSPSAPRQKRTKMAAKEPERQSTPPRIILPDDFLSPDGKAKRPSALDIPETIANTPSPERPSRSLRVTSRSPSAPAVEASLDTGFLGHSDDSGVESKRRKISRVSLVYSPPKSRGKTTDGLKKRLSRGNARPAPTNTQLDLSFDVDDSSLSDLSSADELTDQNLTQAQCPYCKSPVDRDALQKFSKGAYMTLRMQRRFCTQHKKDDARAEWKLKGYPDIDWARLDERISSHHHYLEQILRGKQCHYGDLLAGDVRAGLKRDLAKADFNSTPGYYGERGFRVMQEGIFARFSKLLRKRAVEDGLVSARGYSLYVQAVLVPELAVRLVMEDMGVAEELARAILEESTWVGDLLCEDEGDVVDENDENLF